jgi:hypothetical protein
MTLFNKKIKLIIVVSLAGQLLSLQFLISISLYCCCDPASPQLEISSILDCSDMDICSSEHSQKELITENVKLSKQRCVNDLPDQLLFRKVKSAKNLKQPIYSSIILFDGSISRNSIPFNCILINKFSPHNRFIEEISSVQLLI